MKGKEWFLVSFFQEGVIPVKVRCYHGDNRKVQESEMDRNRLVVLW